VTVQVNDDGQSFVINPAAALLKGVSPVEKIKVTQPPERERPKVPVELTLRHAASDGSGARSAFLLATSKIPGSKTTPAEAQVIKARTLFKESANQLTAALRTSKRVLGTEREFLLEAINIEPDFFTTPSAMVVRVDTAWEILSTRVEQFRADAEDDGTPSDEAAELRSLVRTMESMMDRIGAPPSGQRLSETLDVEAVDGMNKKDLQFVARSYSIATLDALPPEVRSAMAKKLK